MSAMYNNQPYPMSNNMNNYSNNQYSGYQQQPQNFNRGETLAVDVINGEAAANAYLIAPGVTTFLVDLQNNRLYVKSLLYPMRIFDLTEFVQQPSIPQAQIGVNNQVVANDTAMLQSQIDELKQIILSMNTQQVHQPNPQINNNQQQRNNKKGGNGQQ